MTDILPPDLPFPDAPKRDGRIVWTAVLSGFVHLLVFGILLLPPLLKLAEPKPPEAIAVDIVTPSQLASLDSSSVPPSSEEELSSSEPPSSEAPSSSGPPDSSAAPSASSAEASSAQPSSESAASSEAPSSAEASSAPEASSAASEQAASEAAASASSEAAPKPMPAPPLVIPVGPEESSAEASTAPSEEASSAADNSGPPADNAPVPSSAVPKINGPLHVASQFYASALLQMPQMEATRKAIKALPKPRRIAQMCNLEAMGQLARTPSHLQPNALVADAFAATVAAGQTVSAPGGAFRSGATWYGVAFKCTVAADLASVTAFSFQIGAPLPGPPARALPAPKSGQ